jgi:hypothetical protein
VRRSIVLSIVLGLLLAGCAHHYQKVENGTVKLFLRAPDAREVVFVFSLDGYRPHPARKIDTSTWMVSAPAGEGFSYFYLVDGRVLVPECAYREDDGFGQGSCIYLPDM